MDDKFIKKIFLFSLLGYILIAFFILFGWLTDLLKFSFTEAILITSISFALGIFSLFGTKYYKLIYTLPFLLVISLAYISSLKFIVLTTFWILPEVIALATDNIKYVISVIITTIVFYTVFRITEQLPKGFESVKRVPYVIGHVIPFIIEFVVVSSVAYPMLEIYKRYKKDQIIASKQTIEFCSEITAYHSAYLEVHANNVEKYTKLIVNYLLKNGKGSILGNVPPDDIIFGSKIHDIGKCYISDSILDKNGKLTDDEFIKIKHHPEKGSEVFDKLPNIVLTDKTKETFRNIILYHHERLDGSGYPKHLTGESIPVEAKIVAVADVTDALLSYRSYKKPFSKELFFKEMTKEKGVMLEPYFVDIILDNFEEVSKIADEGNIILKHYSEAFKISV